LRLQLAWYGKAFQNDSFQQIHETPQLCPLTQPSTAGYHESEPQVGFSGQAKRSDAGSSDRTFHLFTTLWPPNTVSDGPTHPPRGAAFHRKAPFRPQNRNQ
jgi:hypothetical protein